MNNKKYVVDFSFDADEKTLEQFESCKNEDFVVKAALMPDAHVGYVAPIGSIFVTRDFVVPAWVGYDIGCGVIACRFFGVDDFPGSVKERAKDIFRSVKREIPMGKGEINSRERLHPEIKKRFDEILTEFTKGEYDEEVLDFLMRKAVFHLGSLGSGNHFISLGEAEGELWLVIHSGSRGIGHKIATRYMKEVSGKEKGFEATFPIKADSQLGREYLNVLKFAMDFALLNRLEMAQRVRDVLRDFFGDRVDFELWANKHHNHAVFEDGLFIHRKGATPAKKGERGVIPGNMRDGSFLVEGLGNLNFLESSTHGAGRRLSRTEAKKTLSVDEFRETMKDVVGDIGDRTLDEAPGAYKDIYKVMDAQKRSVKIIKHIKPIVNWQ